MDTWLTNDQDMRQTARDDLAKQTGGSLFTREATSRTRSASALNALPNELLMRILDELSHGVMLVTESGKVRLANQAALRDCARSETLRFDAGHLFPRHDHDREGFLKALTAAAQGRRSMVTLRAPDAPTTLSVVPMGGVATNDAVILVVFGKRAVCEPLNLEFFARTHRLTSAETVVVKGLAEGLRPGEIAERAGVAISTVRTQITSVRLKTETSSIGELVRLLTSLPPTVPTLAKMGW